MTTAGPNSPSSVSQYAPAFGGSAGGWSAIGTLSDIFVSDGEYVYSPSLDSGDVATATANWLRLSGFGFSIPSGATIDSVDVEIQARQSSGSGTIQIIGRSGLISTGGESDQLYDHGPAGPLGGTFAYVLATGGFGGPTYTRADINSANFCVDLQAFVSSGDGTLDIDHVRVTVDYTAGGASQSLTPSLVTNTQTFYSATVTRGAVTLSPSLVASSNAFYAATVSPGAVTLAPALATNSQSFFGPTVTSTYSLLPALLTNGQTFHVPTVAAGAVTLTPSLLTNGQTFYAATVTAGPATLTPGLLSNAQTFFAPTLVPGAVTLAPALLSNPQAFYAPTVVATYSLFPPLATNNSSFFSATVTPGPVILLPPLLTNANYFHAANVRLKRFSFTRDPAPPAFGFVQDAEPPTWGFTKDPPPGSWGFVRDT